MLSYFEDRGYPVPINLNPSDFALDWITPDLLSGAEQTAHRSDTRQLTENRTLKKPPSNWSAYLRN